MLDMKTATVRQLQHNLSEIMRLVDHGEEVRITRRNRVIARLIPDLESPRKIEWPDFAKRVNKLRSIRGKPLSQIVIESRRERF